MTDVKKTEQVMIRLSVEEATALKQAALDDDRPVAQIVRRAVRAYLYDPGAVLNILTEQQIDEAK